MWMTSSLEEESMVIAFAKIHNMGTRTAAGYDFVSGHIKFEILMRYRGTGDLLTDKVVWGSGKSPNWTYRFGSVYRSVLSSEGFREACKIVFKICSNRTVSRPHQSGYSWWIKYPKTTLQWLASQPSRWNSSSSLQYFTFLNREMR